MRLPQTPIEQSSIATHVTIRTGGTRIAAPRISKMDASVVRPEPQGGSARGAGGTSEHTPNVSRQRQNGAQQHKSDLGECLPKRTSTEGREARAAGGVLPPADLSASPPPPTPSS